jgi:hypothetical protein
VPARAKSAAPGFRSVERRKNLPKKEMSVACDFSPALMHDFGRRRKFAPLRGFSLQPDSNIGCCRDRSKTDGPRCPARFD